jgi:hypothetical protein
MQNQSQKPGEVKKQNTPEVQKPQETKKQQGTQELNEDDEQEVSGGSGLLSGGNDLTNMIDGTIGLSNSSSGSGTQNGQTNSYTSNSNTTGNLGLGNQLDNMNF